MRFGLSSALTIRLTGKFFIRLVFFQGDELVCDNFAVNDVSEVFKEINPLRFVGKTLESCQKTLLEESQVNGNNSTVTEGGYIVTYKFKDGSHLNVWGGTQEDAIA